MVRRHHLIEIKGIKELTLSISSTPHHATLPPINHSIERNHGSQIVSMRVLQQNQGESGHNADCLSLPSLTRTRHQAASFNNLGSLREQCGRDRDAKCLCCREIYDQVEVRWLLNRQITGFRTL